MSNSQQGYSIYFRSLMRIGLASAFLVANANAQVDVTNATLGQGENAVSNTPLDIDTRLITLAGDPPPLTPEVTHEVVENSLEFTPPIPSEVERKAMKIVNASDAEIYPIAPTAVVVDPILGFEIATLRSGTASLTPAQSLAAMRDDYLAQVPSFDHLVNLADMDLSVPIQNAVATLVSDPIERQTVAEFYTARAFRPVFVTNVDTMKSVASVMAQAPIHGLPAGRYAVPAQYATTAPADLAALEVAMATAVMRYVADMERGLVKPRDLSDEFDFEPTGRTPIALLQDFAIASDKARFLEALVPNDPNYWPMVEELAHLKRLSGSHVIDLPKVPEGDTLRIGDRHPRVAMLRTRLAALGYPAIAGSVRAQAAPVAEAILAEIEGVDATDGETLSVETSATQGVPNYFDEGLEAAVRAFQSDVGIGVDGIVGPATLGNINTGPEDKIRSLLVGLERHRWGPQSRDGRQIFVNIANYTAEIRDDNTKTFETPVVVGMNRDGWRTPEFHDEMTHLVVNPKWYIPKSISVNEYLPKIRRDPGYLERNNITMYVSATGQKISPYNIDYSQYTEENFPYLLVQGQGNGNALGDVKFMFPNAHNIYLHDTPSKGLFSRSIRAFSHGCVRVGDPIDLALALLAKQTHDPSALFASLRATGETQEIDLVEPVPIHLTYFTAFVNNNGRVGYAEDSYGRDTMLRARLEAMGVDFS